MQNYSHREAYGIVPVEIKVCPKIA